MSIVSKRALLLGAAALNLAAVGVLGQAPEKKPDPPPSRLPFSALKPDATVEITGQPAGSATSMVLSATDDAVWVSSRTTGSVTRIDPRTNAIVATVALGHEPCTGPIGAFGSLWVGECGQPGLARIDLKTNTLTATIKSAISSNPRALATGVASIWLITDLKGTLARFDPATNAAVAEINLPAGSNALAFGQGALWATSPQDHTLVRINPYNNLLVETIKVGKSPRAVSAGEGAVWTLNHGDGTISRVDSKTNKVAATLTVGAVGAGAEIAAGEGSVWVSGPGTPLIRIDPRTNRVVQQFSGEGGGAIGIAHGSVWIAVGPHTIWRLDPRRIEATRPQ